MDIKKLDCDKGCDIQHAETQSFYIAVFINPAAYVTNSEFQRMQKEQASEISALFFIPRKQKTMLDTYNLAALHQKPVNAFSVMSPVQS